MPALSLDLRKRIVAAYDRGGRTQQEVAEIFGVSLGTVRKLLAQRRRTGDLSPRYDRCGGRRKILAGDEQKIRELLRARPDATLEELRDGAGLDCTVQAVHYALKRMGFTYKKKTLRASEQGARGCGPPRARGGGAGSRGLDPARLVFIDESGAKTNMTRPRGRAPRGERLHAAAPCGRWESTTMISSIRLDGSTACMTVGGATNTEIFQAYVAEILLPTLEDGDIVVMDNLSAHKKRTHYRADRLRGRERRVPAALLARPQPHRDDVEQGEIDPAQHRAQGQRFALRGSRPSPLLHIPPPTPSAGSPTAATTSFKML